MIKIDKVKGSSTYILYDGDKIVAKGDKKKMTRKMNQLKRERGE